MKQILITIALFISFTVHAAEQCQKNTDSLGAEYAYSKMPINKKSDNKHTMNLWRMENQVAQEYLDTGMTEVWQKLSNGELRLIRYFDHDKQAIEYQPGEVSYHNAKSYWQQLQHMVDDAMLAKMTLTNKVGSGCNYVETYQLNTDKQTLTIDWMPQYHLTKSLSKVVNGIETNWQLVKLIDQQQKILDTFKIREQYRSTDYADIGDNESDPFLKKMISLGYVEHGPSGFYDADGKDIGEGHAHH